VIRPLHGPAFLPLLAVGALLLGAPSARAADLALSPADIVALSDVSRPPEAAPRLVRDPALVFDDTILTISARTQDFNGQAIVPRYAHLRRSLGARRLDVDQVLLRGVYGFDADTTATVLLPWVRKDLREPAPGGGRRNITTSGLGDMLVLGKRQLHKTFGPARATVVSMLFGVKLPTGSTGKRHAGMRLPRPLQPGSGSWDVLGGGAFTHVDGRWLLNADALFRLNTSAEGFRFGNEWRLDVGGQYRLLPAKYKSFDETTVNLIAEINVRHRGRDRASGAIVRDSGGWQAWFTPGVQVIVSENLLFEGAVQIPMFQDLHGAQLEDDFLVIVGLRALF